MEKCRNAKSIPTNVVCPQCQQGKLVARRAKSGKGRPFYGCSTYPNCNFITNRLPKPNEPAVPASDGEANPAPESEGTHG